LVECGLDVKPGFFDWQTGLLQTVPSAILTVPRAAAWSRMEKSEQGRPFNHKCRCSYRPAKAKGLRKTQDAFEPPTAATPQASKSKIRFDRQIAPIAVVGARQRFTQAIATRGIIPSNLAWKPHGLAPLPLPPEDRSAANPPRQLEIRGGKGSLPAGFSSVSARIGRR
jgi:hypothetical protein